MLQQMKLEKARRAKGKNESAICQKLEWPGVQSTEMNDDSAISQEVCAFLNFLLRFQLGCFPEKNVAVLSIHVQSTMGFGWR